MKRLKKEISEYSRKLKQEQQELIKKIKLPNSVVNLFGAVKDLTILQDNKKAVTTESHYYLQRLFKELARRTKMNYFDFYFLLKEEIRDILLSSKAMKNIVQERKKLSLTILENGKEKILHGREAKEYTKKENILLPSQESDEKSNEIEGVIGSQGFAVGKVCVVNKLKEMSKFKKGQILVTTMTLPGFIPIMKKAKAIITNEGGVTCHAAIVSRELGIPCVIDTKIATKVLKDGDLVEVDANKGVIKVLKKPQEKKIEWQEYIRSGATYHHCIPPFEAFSFGIKKYFGQGVKYLMGYFKGDTLFWYYDKEDLYEVGKRVVEKLTTSKKFENDFFKLWDKKTKEALGFIKKNTPEKLVKISKQELIKTYKKYAQMILDWYSLSMSIDGTDEALMIDITQGVKDILKKQLKKRYTEKEFVRVYNILTLPSYPSYINDERKLILEIIKDISRGKIKEGTPEFNRCVQRIANIFWWTELGWPRAKGKTILDIIKAVKEVRKSKIDVEEELKRMSDYEKNTKAQKQNLEKKYHFQKNRKLSEWLRLSDKLVEYHDYRKEVQMKGNFWEYEILDEISKRTKTSLKLLDWCEPNEIIMLLEKGKFNESEISQRSSRFLCFNIEGKITKLSGKAAEREHERILGLEVEETRDLQGMSASGGKVVGEAFVAITTSSALKIKKGQILVTGMTTPDFVPAMRKAAAIVTDEGGITCHAAIVSRELSLPCVIGTKYATRLIKSGDIIEVAANHGVVKILKKVE